MLQQSDVFVNVGFMYNVNRWLYEYEKLFYIDIIMHYKC